MRAEILAVGDELTTGQRLDTNSQWLSERLVEMGIEVAFHTTVGDNPTDHVAAVRVAIDRADIVICTGGLGPTADDLTRDAFAAAAGVELVHDEREAERIRQIFARWGRKMPERNLLQAQFPRGSRPIPNPHGTAPGIDMTVARPDRPPCRLFALPGVPAEMFAMWAESVAPAIHAIEPEHRVTVHRRIKCFGAGESHIESMLPDLIRRGREPRVGITVSDTTITLRITASGADAAACAAAIEPTVAQIHKLLGVLVFGEEDEELEDVVVRLLQERRQSVAVAEWATEGLVTEWLAKAAGTTPVMRGGVIVCDSAELASLLDIAHGAGATEETAEQMARAIRERTGADFGLAVAAPPEVRMAAKANTSEDKSGQQHIALATPATVTPKGFPVLGHPAVRRPRAAKQALNMLRLALLNREATP